jgi:uncharacterized BrkB/YihY/UPF0761 family membrane protein
MSADRRRRRAFSENELLAIYVVLGVVLGFVLALAFGWPALPHVALGVVVGSLRSGWEEWQRERHDRSDG